VLIGAIAFVVLNLVSILWQSPAAKDQQVIDQCWQGSKGTALTVEQRQVTGRACRALEV